MTGNLFAALYMDENVDLLVAFMLQAQGFDVVTTHDLQYINNNREHMGIVVAIQRRPGEVAGRIAHLLDTYTADEIAGQLFYV